MISHKVAKAFENRKFQIAFHSREEPFRHTPCDHEILAAENEKRKPRERKQVEEASDYDGCVFGIDKLHRSLQ